MPKRILQGVVVSDKAEKTIIVKVERRFTHPVMKKTVRRTKNYHAHDEDNSAKIGDRVSIREARPRSKLKTWELVTGSDQGSDDKGGDDKGLIAGLVSGVKSLLGVSKEG